VGITLDLRRARPADVHVGRSPLAELLSVLHILAEPDHHPEARLWTRRLGTAMGPALTDEMRVFSPLWARLRCRLLFPLAPPLEQSLATELGHIRDLPLEEFVDLAADGVVGFHDTIPPAPRLLNDAEAARRYVAQCERRSFRRGELAHELVTSPERTRTRLVAFLRDCADAFFTTEWLSVGDRLGEAVGRVRSDVRRRDLADVLADLSPTAVVSGDGTRVRYDKLMVEEIEVGPRPLLLIPSVHVWPHLMIKNEGHYPAVIQFGAREGAVGDQITLRQLHDRLSALASPGRMELCRHLLGEPITTSELARRVGLADTQVSRTIRQLREAGLIESERDGKYIYHRLATRTVLRLGYDVLATVMR
jgi:DNA-binding transcriptional ArsR family regulator